MPRKTDGIVFELHPGAKKGEDGKPLLYARPKITVTYDTKGLDDYCNTYYFSVSKQVQNILSQRVCPSVSAEQNENKLKKYWEI